MKKVLLIISSLLVLISCSSDGYKFPQANIKTNIEPLEIHRYGKTLFEIDQDDFQDNLKKTQNDYRLFLDADLDDSLNIIQLLEYVSDTQLIGIYQRVIDVYPDLQDEEQILAEALSRYHYYFPKKQLPNVYTYISDLYFEIPIWKKDSALIIAIDVYLGKDFHLYNQLGLPYYKVRCMTPENLPVDAMKTLYFDEIATYYKKKTLLDHMIEGGKILTYLDAVLPEVPDSVKICYTSKKLDWAKENEKNVWGFLIENDLLYSTEYQSQTKLIQDGPFTNGFSNDSPSRLGIYIGWQIVNQFMIKNPDVSLQEMLNMTDSQMILQRSAYKP